MYYLVIIKTLELCLSQQTLFFTMTSEFLSLNQDIMVRGLGEFSDSVW